MEEHILPETGCISECWWQLVHAVYWSLSLLIVKLCTVAHPGRQAAIHSRTRNGTSTTDKNSDLQWASTHGSNSKMSWLPCLGFAMRSWEVVLMSRTMNNGQ